MLIIWVSHTNFGKGRMEWLMITDEIFCVFWKIVMFYSKVNAGAKKNAIKSYEEFADTNYVSL